MIGYNLHVTLVTTLLQPEPSQNSCRYEQAVFRHQLKFI